VTTDAAGWMLSGHDFYPFGMEVAESGEAAGGPSRMKFTGHERDDLTGLDYMKARYSGWFQASFLIPDPANDVNPRNPQSWNRYAYVRNNPIRLVDPTGLYTVLCKDQGDACEKAQRDFERERLQLLQSKNESVRQAAKAYGDPDTANGVVVEFHKVIPGKKKNKPGDTDNGVDETGKRKSTVRIRMGIDSNEMRTTVAHEGNHLARFADALKSAEPDGMVDDSFKTTTYEKEYAAYEVTYAVVRELDRSLEVGGVRLKPRDPPGVVDANIKKILRTNYEVDGRPLTPDNPGSRDF
jgi:RHS repeat-associated protein